MAAKGAGKKQYQKHAAALAARGDLPGPEPTRGRRYAVSFRVPVGLLQAFDDEAELRTVAAKQKGKPKVTRGGLVIDAMERFAKGFK